VFAYLLTDIIWVILELIKHVFFGTGIFFEPIDEILAFAHSTLPLNDVDILKPHSITELTGYLVLNLSFWPLLQVVISQITSRKSAYIPSSLTTSNLIPAGRHA
jgi:hypothetical protein